MMRKIDIRKWLRQGRIEVAAGWIALKIFEFPIILCGRWFALFF